jgi:hypothetical protein
MRTSSPSSERLNAHPTSGIACGPAGRLLPLALDQARRAAGAPALSSPAPVTAASTAVRLSALVRRTLGALG